jgi:Ctr copper transporter family
MRNAMVLSGSKTRTYGDDPNSNEDVAIGCGNIIPFGSDEGFERASSRFSSGQGRRRLQMVTDASVCNNSTNFYCWMSCLDIPEVTNAQGRLNDGYALYCLDPAVLPATGYNVSKAVEPCTESGVVGRAMSSSCMGSWQHVAAGVPSQELALDKASVDNAIEEPFCYGGTSMYMDGFHWVDTTCVIYLFPEWILSTPGKLAAACIGSLFLGMLLEGVIRGRRDLVQSMPIGWKRLGLSATIYGFQLTMGYFAMLVVMTYSGPLFMCVVLGLVFGHIAFNAKDVALALNDAKKAADYRKDANEVTCSDDSRGLEEALPPSSHMKAEDVIRSAHVPEGSTPCCQNEL